ncbi:hypothetical protein ACI2TA_25035 [Ralstonia nicotianae]
MSEIELRFTEEELQVLEQVCRQQGLASTQQAAEWLVKTFLRARLKIPRRCGVKAGCGKKNIENARRSWVARPSGTQAT